MAQSYRLRVYADPAGVVSISVQTTAGSEFGTVIPQGDTVPGFDEDAISIPVRLVPNIRNGYVFVKWVINDGISVSESTSRILYFYNNGNGTNVRIRIVVSIPQTYYGVLSYDANGGTGAPQDQPESSESPQIFATISTIIPQRTGYTFLGWSMDRYATSPSYYQGGVIELQTSEIPPGPTTILYAVWSAGGSSGVWIGNGNNFQFYLPYIYTGSWQRCDPYIYTDSWRKAVQ